MDAKAALQGVIIASDFALRGLAGELPQNFQCKSSVQKYFALPRRSGARRSNIYHWLGFAAYAVEYDRPFLSETGYRSFVAIGGELEPGFTPDRFAAEVIGAHVRCELKGCLVTIEPRYRQREPEPS